MLQPDWENLSDPILLQIFNLMTISNICKITQVCKNWNRLCQDEILWKQFFIRDFQLSHESKLSNGNQESWKMEYKRLMDEVPLIECQNIVEHYNQVLHVSFSNNGKIFATTSKDSMVMVWSATHPCHNLYFKNMGHYQWSYTQFSQFNSTDELLLVSGVHYGEASTSGEIIILKIEEGLPMQCRSINRPYDLFGAWYNSQYFLSGEFHWLGQMRSANMLWLNRASQEAHSEHIAVVLRFCQFFNENATSIRSLMICDAPDPYLTSSQSEAKKRDVALSTPYETVKSKSGRLGEEGSIEPDKLLIFTTGSRVCTPHQIGIKEIRKYHIDSQIHIDPQMISMMLRRRAQEQLRRQGVINPENELNLNSIEEHFDTIDHVIDLNGQIIGMALSPDNRYLYVNCRAWPTDVQIVEPLDPPSLSNDIDIHVIDLATAQKVGTPLRSHKAYTPKSSCYFIFLNVSHSYVVSGAEDCRAHIWDRFYKMCLARLPHKDVVNCVAFNPIDQEMLVTVGDDNAIKIWRSRKQVRNFQIPIEPQKIDEQRIRACS